MPESDNKQCFDDTVNATGIATGSGSTDNLQAPSVMTSQSSDALEQQVVARSAQATTHGVQIASSSSNCASPDGLADTSSHSSTSHPQPKQPDGNSSTLHDLPQRSASSTFDQPLHQAHSQTGRSDGGQSVAAAASLRTSSNESLGFGQQHSTADTAKGSGNSVSYAVTAAEVDGWGDPITPQGQQQQPQPHKRTSSKYSPGAVGRGPGAAGRSPEAASKGSQGHSSQFSGKSPHSHRQRGPDHSSSFHSKQPLSTAHSYHADAVSTDRQQQFPHGAGSHHSQSSLLSYAFPQASGQRHKQAASQPTPPSPLTKPHDSFFDSFGTFHSKGGKQGHVEDKWQDKSQAAGSDTFGTFLSSGSRYSQPGDKQYNESQSAISDTFGTFDSRKRQHNPARDLPMLTGKQQSSMGHEPKDEHHSFVSSPHSEMGTYKPRLKQDGPSRS